MNISDAQTIIQKKIVINRMAIENMNHQIQYCNAIARIQLLTIKLLKEKIKLLNQINPVLEQQITNFTLERQQMCHDTYALINDMDDMTNNTEYMNLCRIVSNMNDKMESLTKKIKTIEDTIPNQQVITNYRVPIEDTCCRD